LNRTNKRFEKVFELAKQFLLNETNTMQYDDTKRTFVILFKMNDLFEMYIAIVLESIVKDPVYVQDRRHRLFKNERTDLGIFQLMPDVVIGEQDQIIIDTKWKQIFAKNEVNRSGVQRDDMYQMYAYLTRYKQASRGILLYPKTFEPVEKELYLQSWKVEGENKLLRVYMVSLIKREKTEDELRLILANVKNEVKGLMQNVDETNTNK
jgi:5-methylcytosine-specific restriction enzyme subunit McrC